MGHRNGVFKQKEYFLLYFNFRHPCPCPKYKSQFLFDLLQAAQKSLKFLELILKNLHVEGPATTLLEQVWLLLKPYP